MDRLLENMRRDNRLNSVYLQQETGLYMMREGRLSIRDLIVDGDQDPDSPAIESPEHEPLSYRRLRQQILRVVMDLNGRGFHRNDRIAIISPAGPDTAVLTVSIMAGFTCVMMNPESTAQEYHRYFSFLKIKAIILRKCCETAATAVAGELDIPVIELEPLPGVAGLFELLPRTSRKVRHAELAVPSDTAILLLTSGTTGIEKIVPLTQQQFLLTQKRLATASGISRMDRCLHILPYYHGMGLSLPLLGTLIVGGTVICSENFIPADFLPLLKACRPTFYSAGPAVHQGILRELRKVPPKELEDNSLRMIRSASAPMSASIHEGLRELLGVPVIESYGMSEAGTIAVNFPPRPGSVGIPVIEQLRIIDETGTTLTLGETGEIVVRGGTVFDGYEDAPEETGAAFIDGWFRTGDMGYLDDDGYLFLTGRKKEIINKGGRKIAPAEIDAALMSHSGVLEAMTFAVRDPVLGEDIAAMVVREHKTLSEDDLRRYLLDRLLPAKVPKRIFFVDSIPKNPAGKPLRQEGTKRYS